MLVPYNLKYDLSAKQAIFGDYAKTILQMGSYAILYVGTVAIARDVSHTAIEAATNWEWSGEYIGKVVLNMGLQFGGGKVLGKLIGSFSKGVGNLAGKAITKFEEIGAKSAVAITKASNNVIQKVVCIVTGNACFVAGTMILTSYGLKPIEQIKLGDEVYAQSINTKEKGIKK